MTCFTLGFFSFAQYNHLRADSLLFSVSCLFSLSVVLWVYCVLVLFLSIYVIFTMVRFCRSKFCGPCVSRGKKKGFLKKNLSKVTLVFSGWCMLSTEPECWTLRVCCAWRSEVEQWTLWFHEPSRATSEWRRHSLDSDSGAGMGDVWSRRPGLIDIHAQWGWHEGHLIMCWSQAHMSPSYFSTTPIYSFSALSCVFHVAGSHTVWKKRTISWWKNMCE